MSELTKPDQEEKTPPPQETDQLVGKTNPEESVEWETVLVESSVDNLMVPLPPTGYGKSDQARDWFKVLFPLIVVLAFLGWKTVDSLNLSTKSKNDFRVIDSTPTSLTGVAPQEDGRLRLDRESKAVVAKLEALASANQWGQLREEIANQPEVMQQHPVIQAMDVLARARKGERSVELEVQVRDMEALLRPEERRYPELLQELRLARVELILARARSIEVLSRNTDLIFSLLGTETDSLHDVRVHMNVSRVFETQADKLVKEGDGVFKNDPYLLQEARVYYQTALRPLVTAQGWETLEPISASAKPNINRIAEKLKNCNRMVHGPSIPFSENDSTTWSGKKDGKVHDRF
jgi:hypothetical protein